MKKEGLIAIGWSIIAFIFGVYLITRRDASNIASIYYGRVPQFHFVDELNQPFGYKNLIGKTWLINVNNELGANFPEEISDVEKLTILPIQSIENYISNRSVKVVFGTTLEIQDLVAVGFHLNHSNQEIISNKLILVDKSGNIRGYYSKDDYEALNRLTRDIQTLNRIS